MKFDSLSQAIVTALALMATCLVAMAVHIVAIRFQRPIVGGVAKALASTAFVSLAVAFGAATTVYGRFILAALCFSWLGDVLLISRKSSFLLGGIGAFLLAHVAFAVAFTQVEIGYWAFGCALVITAVAGLLLIQWLWPRLDGFYRIAVPVDVAAIMIMTSLAIGAGTWSMPSIVAVGAVLFAVSDVSVARDRFIEPSFTNKLWGLPLYYVAQILLASSVSEAVAR